MIPKTTITSPSHSMHFSSNFSVNKIIINVKMVADKLKPPFAMYIWNIIPHSTKLLRSTLFFWYKNIVFPAQAEYSYFSANFRLKIFLSHC